MPADDGRACQAPWGSRPPGAQGSVLQRKFPCHAAKILPPTSWGTFIQNTRTPPPVRPVFAQNVIHQFTNLARSDPRIRFFGNVRLGKDVGLDALRKAYHAVVLAYGAESDRSLNIPGEVCGALLLLRRGAPEGEQGQHQSLLPGWLCTNELLSARAAFSGSLRTLANPQTTKTN